MIDLWRVTSCIISKNVYGGFASPLYTFFDIIMIEGIEVKISGRLIWLKAYLEAQQIHDILYHASQSNLYRP